TRNRMTEIVTAPPEPVVLDGAVLRADIGGLPAFFEADEMAIGVNGRILVGENKSWPVVDGRPTDEDALGAALDQAATYVLLGRRRSKRRRPRPSLAPAASITRPFQSRRQDDGGRREHGTRRVLRRTCLRGWARAAPHDVAPHALGRNAVRCVPVATGWRTLP